MITFLGWVYFCLKQAQFRAEKNRGVKKIKKRFTRSAKRCETAFSVSTTVYG